MNLKCQTRLSNLDIYCVHAFFTARGVIVYDVALADVVDQTSYVHEDFLFRGVVNDEAKTFGLIEELYCSSIH